MKLPLPAPIHASKTLVATGMAVSIALSPFVAYLSPTHAQAQVVEPTAEQTTLTAIPPRIGEDNSLVLEPGESTQISIRVRNSSTNAQTVFTTKQDFIVSPEDGKTPIPVSDTVSNRWSLASWITLTPTQQQLQPNQTGGISVLIEVPEDALPGGHYAMITHQPGGSDLELLNTTNQKASSVQQKVGTLVYVRVAGPINEEAFVRDFSFPQFSEYGPVPFSFTVENRSDIHITPQTSVEIYNIFNQKVETIQIEPKNVFPLTSRDFDGQWDRVWGWGLYNAKLVLSYGEQGQVVVDHAQFWLIPIKLVLAAIIGILVLLAVGISVRRHLIHRSNNDQEKIALLEKRLQSIESDKLKKYKD